MHTSPFSIHNLNPRLVEDVEKAFQQNVEAGRVVDDKFADDVAKESLAGLLDTGLQTARENGQLPDNNGLEAISNPDIRKSLETAIIQTALLFGKHLNINPPNAEMITENDINLGMLSKRYETMQNDGLEPQWILAPSLPASHWRHLFASLAQNQLLRGHGKPSPSRPDLDIHRDIEANFDYLDQLPSSVIRIPRAEYTWTLRLIPGTRRPPSLNASYDSFDRPALREYLTLQALQLQANMLVLDSNGEWTWIGNPLITDGVTHGIRGGYDYGSIVLKPLIVNHRSSSIGARVPVWK